MFLGYDMQNFTLGGCKFTVDNYFRPVKTIGSGAYGVVCAASDTRTNKKVAIKKITGAFGDLIDAKRILREVRMLMHLKHPNVCDLQDMIPPQSQHNFKDVYLVLEYMETDLHKIIYSKNTLTQQHYQYFTYQLLRGLKYIHSAGIIHRDLKPSNILLNSNCDLKICDFGLARSNQDENSMTQYVVTRWYRAPEIMVCDEFYDTKVDVWSVGCILAEMIKTSPLFPGDHYIQQLNLIFQTLGTPNPNELTWVKNEKALQFIRNQKRLQRRDFRHLFSKASNEAVAILNAMLRFDPNQRISVNEALEMPFLSNYHNSGDEPTCPSLFDHSYEQGNLDINSIKQHMYNAIVHFRQA